MKMMNIQIDSKHGFAMIVLAALVGSGSVAAFGGTKTSAPASHASAPAARPAAPASHSSSGGGTASHSTGSSTAGHTGSTGSTTHSGPTANGTHTTTTTGARTTGTTTGTRTTATTGNRTSGSPSSVHSTSTPKGTSPSATGKISSPMAKGTHETTAKNGAAVRTRANGKVSDLHDEKRGMDIHHGVAGGTRVSVARHDGSHLVAERGRRGYVERGFRYGGHDFHSRAYFYHGAYYNRYYRGYYYGGVYMNVYAPGYFYNPYFYGWAYNPWAAPISFGWGWGGSPWYGFYGGYFNPYPVYPSASFWLADYLIANSLQAAYAAHKEAQVEDEVAAAGNSGPILTDAIKAQIADEVKAQLALENQEATQTAANQDVDPASSGISRLLNDGHAHVFVVGDGLDLTDDSGQECAVSEGDALALKTPPPSDATTADVVVLASKGGKECHSGGTVAVQLSDLQEMQNHLRETIDQGLKELQEKQGKGGIPQAPASAQAPPTKTQYADIAPPPDPKDAADIQAQTQEADKAETEAKAGLPADGTTPAVASADAGAAPTTTATVAIGQTPDQVIGELGQPTRKADLPGKLIYFYSGMKVTFKGGKVADVE